MKNILLRTDHVVNATISSTMLGIEDHGIFTCVLGMEYGDGDHQGFGTHDLKFAKYGIAYLRSILEIVGVDSWESLEGRTVRVVKGSKSFSASIVGIGNITKNVWFFPQREAEK